MDTAVLVRVQEGCADILNSSWGRCGSVRSFAPTHDIRKDDLANGPVMRLEIKARGSLISQYGSRWLQQRYEETLTIPPCGDFFVAGFSLHLERTREMALEAFDDIHNFHDRGKGASQGMAKERPIAQDSLRVKLADWSAATEPRSVSRKTCFGKICF